MSRFSSLGFLFLVLCFPASVNATGRSTVDPNAGRPKASKTAPSNDVTQKVTYEAKRKTALSILTDLSKMTGVTLKAGYNNEDWQVRDRRMNIFVKDLPLTNLMDSIARVMKFQWLKHETDGVVSYRLYMDRKVLLGAERQRYIEEEKLKQRQVEARKRLTAGLESADGKSGFELEALKTQSPYIYVLAEKGYASFLPRLLREVPLANEAFLSGTDYVIDIGALSPELQQGIEAFEQAQKRTGPGYATRRGNVSDGTIVINGSQYIKGYALAAKCVADVMVSVPGAGIQMGMEDPESDSAKVWAQLTCARWQRDEPEQTRLYQLLTRTEGSAIADLSEPQWQHADDPLLAKLVELNVDGDKFADVLFALAESSGFAVVSDTFESKFYGLTFAKEKTKVRAVLDKVESVCHYNWDRHESTLELHDRDWFRKRAAQIPDAWLEAWRTALQTHGTLNISELSRIASLTPEQVWTNIIPDDVLGTRDLASLVAQYRNVLSVYGALNRQQQALVFTKQGLNFSTLADDQYKTAQVLLQQRPTLKSAAKEELNFVGTRTNEGKRIRYVLSIIRRSGDSLGGQWVILSPEYIPPAKPKVTDVPSSRPEVKK